MPGKFVDRVGVNVEPVGVQGKARICDHAMAFAHDPLVNGSRGRNHRQIEVLSIHQHKLRGIPQLVAEVAITLNAVGIKAYVTAGSGKAAKVKRKASLPYAAIPSGKSLRVCFSIRFAILGWVRLLVRLATRTQVDAINEIQGIEPVALGFRHFLTLGILNQTVDVDRVERNFVGKVQGHHNHAGNPKRK